MILLGLGGNLQSEAGGPAATAEAALQRLAQAGVALEALSPWYESAPIPASDQPWFLNAVAKVSTAKNPEMLLALLHQVEADLGRVRTVPNAARVIDLDLLAYNDLVQPGPPILPHPRLQDRAFVLYPLKDVAPGWRHPALGKSVDAMIADLAGEQLIRLVVPGAP